MKDMNKMVQLAHLADEVGLNDHRAAHTVNYCGGCNVKIPYRGYQISLAADGSYTIVESKSPFSDEAEDIIDVGIICGTDGESILRAMRIIDILEEEK